MEIQFNIGIPIYKQLASLIDEQIKQGVYKPGQQIPPEDVLCRRYDISRVTVRKAISLLSDEGIVVKQQGKGTFVTMSSIVGNSKAHGSFTLSCKDNGVVPTTKIVSCKVMEAPAVIAADMQLADGDKIVCIKRLRCANDVPVILETDYIPYSKHSYLVDTPLENVSLLETISQHSGLTSSGCEDIIDILLATEEESEHLNCKKGTPLLRVYQKVFYTGEDVMYLNTQLISSEHYKYTSNYKK